MYMKKFLLPLNLQFFAADTGGGNGDGADSGAEDKGTDETKTDQSQETETKTDETKSENSIPKSRFDEVNNKYKELQAQMDALTKEKSKEAKQKEKAEQEAREKAGEFEGLYNEAKSSLTNLELDVTTKTERIGVLEAVVQELLDTQMKDIDKEYHDLIPENLTVEAKLSWISKAKQKGMFGTKNNVGNPIGGPTNPATTTVKTENMSAGDLFRLAFSKK